MPISDGMGLVFSVTSYDGMIFISVTSCREQVPDPEFLAQCIRDSFQEYLALADAPPAVRRGVVADGGDRVLASVAVEQRLKRVARHLDAALQRGDGD